MAKVIQVIETEEYRGTGTPGDPHRRAYQLWTFDGHLIFERDDWDAIQKSSIKAYAERAKVNTEGVEK